MLPLAVAVTLFFVNLKEITGKQHFTCWSLAVVRLPPVCTNAKHATNTMGGSRVEDRERIAVKRSNDLQATARKNLQLNLSRSWPNANRGGAV